MVFDIPGWTLTIYYTLIITHSFHIATVNNNSNILSNIVKLVKWTKLTDKI